MSVTLVSVSPRKIFEEKPHIRPSMYRVDAAPTDDIAILVIEDAIDYVYAGEGKHIDRIVLASEVAKSIIASHCGSQLVTNPNAQPGLFYVDGKLNKAEIKTKFKAEIDEAKKRQRSWFINIVKDADDLWQRFRQHRVISQLHRDACNYLNMKREWNITVDPDANILCPACGANLPHPQVTICGTCRTIIKPEEHAKRFGLAGATK